MDRDILSPASRLVKEQVHSRSQTTAHAQPDHVANMQNSSKDMNDAVIAATKDCKAPDWNTSAFQRLLDQGWDINENLGNMGDALMYDLRNRKGLIQLTSLPQAEL